jgi:preprotein translocase subunit SecB
MFVLEIEHAAVFLIRNIPEEHHEMVLKVDCPTLLFPFTRQIVSQVSIDGGFTPFLMEPINFMALFQSAKKKSEEKLETKKPSTLLRAAAFHKGYSIPSVVIFIRDRC